MSDWGWVEQAFLVAGNVFVIGMAPALAFFLFFYRSRYGSNPRENEIGLALLGSKIAMLFLVLTIIAGNFLPEDFDLLRRTIRAFGFLGVLLFLVVDDVNLRLMQMGRPDRLLFGKLVKRRNFGSRR